MRFKELPAEERPNSEASGNTRSDSGAVSNDLLTTVIERWRSASMSHRGDDMADYASYEAPPLQPAQAAAQPVPVQPSPRGEALRSSLLKKPLDTGAHGAPPSPPGYPPRFR